ncbi:hypothetical protein BC830DRAFT_1159419, partial [Chytriomyces sp. MP71]
KKACEYKFFTEFQSHEPKFDYLKSLEIEEKINKIRWCHRQNSAHFLLSTNDKTVKLWKVFEKSIKMVSETNVPEGATHRLPIANTSSLKLPRMIHHDTMIAAVPRKVYQDAHTYHINSISVNSDGETYLSADDLRVNLWSLDSAAESFNIVDIKPVNMEELTEVITACEFHPSHCNLFAFSSSKGVIKLNDMRAAALCDNHAKAFEVEEDAASKSFFSEIISSISDIRFSRNGRYILSRDYLTLKVWDINMEGKPVETVNIHEHLKGKLCDLYENDCIFDKFECMFSGDGRNVLTGSYNNFFQIHDTQTKNNTILQADKNAFKSRKAAAAAAAAKKVPKKSKREEFLNVDGLDFSKKILHASWHPRENVSVLCSFLKLLVLRDPFLLDTCGG